MTNNEANPLPQEAELREAIDKALHIDWAFKKGKPTRIIIDGSMTKGAYHTDYETFVGNIMQLLTDYARKARIDELGIMIHEGSKDNAFVTLYQQLKDRRIALSNPPVAPTGEEE